MSHYDEQRERYYADMAEHLRGQKAEAKPAAPSRLRDLIARMAHAAERIAIAAEHIAAQSGGNVLLPAHDDFPDAPHPAQDETLQTAPSAPLPAPHFTDADRRFLIRHLNHLCWPQCAVSRNEADESISLRLPNTAHALGYVADLLGMDPPTLRALLFSFPSNGVDAQRIAIAFPASWAASA